MNENEKQLTYEEFVKMMLEHEMAFRDVMKICGPADRRTAIQGYNILKQMMKEQIDRFQEKNKVNFHVLEQSLQAAKQAFGEDIKEEFAKIREEVEPILLKSKLQKENSRSKKSRKRKMENRIRAKE